MSKGLRGGISLLIATLLYSLYGVFSRIIGLDFGKVFQITARFSFMFFFFLAYVLIRKKWKRVDVKDYKWYFLMIIPGMIAAIIIFVVFNNLPLGTAYFTLYASSTLSSYLLGSILFKERINKVKIYSLIISLCGLYFIFSDTLELGRTPYLTLMLAAGLGAAAWNVISKKISSKYSINQILLVDSIVLVVVSFPVALLLGEPISLPNFSIPWLGIFGYSSIAVIASIATINGYKQLQAQIGSLIMLVEPFFAAIVGWLLYGEVLAITTLFGGLLIAIGASLPNLSYFTRKR